MVDQLVLKFPKNKVFLKEDFYVSSSNNQAYEFINSWPKWFKRIINVYGPSGSGKSHLVSILKSKTSVFKIESKLLNEDVFLKFKTKEALVIENLNKLVSEPLLFSLWNTVLQDNKYFLITSEEPINILDFKLPDLKSRVDSCINIGIKLPDDALISVILAKNFSDKQINLDKKHIDYIVKRIDRSYEKISQFISVLDTYSLKMSSPISLKLIKEVLKMI
jgi:chromosomal replication initiation ATPase DnaA